MTIALFVLGSLGLTSLALAVVLVALPPRFFVPRAASWRRDAARPVAGVALACLGLLSTVVHPIAALPLLLASVVLLLGTGDHRLERDLLLRAHAAGAINRLRARLGRDALRFDDF